uniref:Uncharacterized protein n=1 Tax=Panagrolaimus sp. PS1159 TaxID=55785 RepID=A0AC35G5I1_9BILA
MTKAKSRKKVVKQVAGSKENAEKKSEKQLSLRSEDYQLANAKNNIRLPRQMIRVHRSEPSDGIIRNELRFVSYASAKDDSEKNPVEMNVISEAFGALVSRLRDLDVAIPEGKEDALLSRLRELNSEEECERLRKIIEEMHNYESDTDGGDYRSGATTITEPSWVEQTEAQIKAVTEKFQPIHLQAQGFAPKLFDIKAHLNQILEEIHDQRLKGQLSDERIREQINDKIHRCRQMAAETIRKNRRN